MAEETGASFASVLSEIEPENSLRKEPRQDRSRALVHAILDATIRVLEREGPDALTTVRVAEVAGVSVGSLYQYFPNKRALTNAALARYLTEVIDETVHLPDSGSLEDDLLALLDGFLAARARICVRTTELRRLSDDAEQLGRTVQGRIEARVAEVLARRGALAPARAAELAGVLASAVVAVVHRAGDVSPRVRDDLASLALGLVRARA